MNQKLDKKKGKKRKAGDVDGEVKSVENAEPIVKVEPNPVENGIKVKKSKKNKNVKNENDDAQKPTEISFQPAENGIKSKKSKKNKTLDAKLEKFQESLESSITDVQPSESVPKVNNVGKKPLKQCLIAENAYISSLMGIINFPKRADDSDDERVFVNKGKKKLFDKKGGAQNVQELRQRLKDKLESLQGPKSDKPGKKSKLSKQEKKLKMQEENRLKSKMAKIRANATPDTSKKTNGVSKAKPVFNAEGKVVYSKFDLGTKPAQNGEQPTKKKDPKSMLQSIQKQKDTLKRLEDRGEKEIATNIKESSAWDKALDKTEGVKVKDDVGLLKKSIKKIEQKKKSSSKKWDERKGNEKQKMDAKQQKRTDNIKKRKTDVKSNKMKKLAKRGRAVPGFR